MTASNWEMVLRQYFPYIRAFEEKEEVDEWARSIKVELTRMNEQPDINGMEVADAIRDLATLLHGAALPRPSDIAVAIRSRRKKAESERKHDLYMLNIKDAIANAEPCDRWDICVQPAKQDDIQALIDFAKKLPGGLKK